MKRKYLDRSKNWPRILKYSFETEYCEKEGGRSYISVMHLEKVRERLIVNTGGKGYCVVDDGYTWLQYLPLDKNWSLTTMYNENKEIVQWYFDITKKNGIDDNGEPFYDDLYLDVVVLPTSEVFLIDEDDLEEALNKNIITKEDFELAYKEARNIMDKKDLSVKTLTEFSNKIFKYLE